MVWKLTMKEGLIELPKIINSETIWNWSGEQRSLQAGVCRRREKGWYEQKLVLRKVLASSAYHIVNPFGER